jgi:heterodisulfide reductase subunit A
MPGSSESVPHGSKGGNSRLGVFICRCGGNISNIINIEKLKETVRTWNPGGTAAVTGTAGSADSKSPVLMIADDEHLCSVEGQGKISDSIVKHGLERVVIAACSPLLHEETFMRCVENAGLNPYLLEIANIREQCSWSCEDTGKAGDKAAALVSGAVGRVMHALPLFRSKVERKKSVVVIGGGVSGITSALSLARQGFKVHLIEKRESIGGNMVRVGKVFAPDKLAEECALCALSPLMSEVARHPGIMLHTLSGVKSIKGCAGNFQVAAETLPSFVNVEKCIGCGACAEACPVSVPDWWNAGLKKRKAIYRPFPQAVPSTFTVDGESCTKCGECIEACAQGAIDLDMKPRTFSIDTGAVIIATGHGEYDASRKPELGYGKLEGVITQTELCRLTAVNGPTLGKLQRPSDGKPPRRVVMVQCVGSRDEKPGGRKYCSKVCCMVAIKHANHIKSFSPFTDVVICYTDLRTPGSYENYLRHAQENGVRFIRGKPGEILRQDDGTLIVRLEDTLSKGGEPVELETDLVVLSEGLEPSPGTVETAEALGVGTGEDGFIAEKHPKLKPVSTDVEGIFACGTALGPKDITESVVQAGAAAAKSSELLMGEIEMEPRAVEIDPSLCDSCRDCINACRYRALYEKNGTVAVDLVACVGCGGCIGVCRHGAISQKYCTDEMIYGQVSGILSGKPQGERTIIAFLDSKVAYIAADNAGANRMAYGDDVFVVRVPSTNRLGLKHVLYALEHGADGVFLGEGPENGPMGKMFGNIQNRYTAMRAELAKKGIDPKRVFFTKVYAPHFRGLVEKLDAFRRDVDSARTKTEPAKVSPG